MNAQEQVDSQEQYGVSSVARVAPLIQRYMVLERFINQRIKDSLDRQVDARRATRTIKQND